MARHTPARRAFLTMEALEDRSVPALLGSVLPPLTSHSDVIALTPLSELELVSLAETGLSADDALIGAPHEADALYGFPDAPIIIHWPCDCNDLIKAEQLEQDAAQLRKDAGTVRAEADRLSAIADSFEKNAQGKGPSELEKQAQGIRKAAERQAAANVSDAIKNAKSSIESAAQSVRDVLGEKETAAKNAVRNFAGAAKANLSQSAPLDTNKNLNNLDEGKQETLITAAADAKRAVQQAEEQSKAIVQKADAQAKALEDLAKQMREAGVPDDDRRTADKNETKAAIQKLRDDAQAARARADQSNNVAAQKEQAAQALRERFIQCLFALKDQNGLQLASLVRISRTAVGKEVLCALSQCLGQGGAPVTIEFVSAADYQTRRAKLGLGKDVRGFTEHTGKNSTVVLQDPANYATSDELLFHELLHAYVNCILPGKLSEAIHHQLTGGDTAPNRQHQADMIQRVFLLQNLQQSGSVLSDEEAKWLQNNAGKYTVAQLEQAARLK